MADDVILNTRGLTKEFKGFVAVRDVDLSVRRGTIHALIGPNGAGKTTCFNLLTHFLTPTRGQIFYNGREITGSRPADDRAHGPGPLVPDLGRVPEADRARERAHRAAAPPRPFVRLLALRGAARAPGRARGRADRGRRPRRLREHGSGRAPVWPQAGARDRDHARARAGDDAARRADRGHGRTRTSSASPR